MVGENNKRKKHHDKDKYYRLAKEQGFRSRAAFKLTQINRKFHFLENAKVVIDLCAAPGGWAQVAARTMNTTRNTNKSSGANENIIVCVDILPIRAINPNVIRIIGDITTDKCRSKIKQELQGCSSADVVLCDGAPNVGAAYDRDAFEQNVIALHSLRCATHHLRRGGTFVTKLYRSAEYTSYVWVAKQLFETVQAVKPTASRSQSAEIFLVCLGYLDPTSIDPKMLDPRSVFEQVDGAATGGGDRVQREGAAGGGITIFHKKYHEKRRSRQGYDMNALDATMRNVGLVSNFVDSSSIRVKDDDDDGDDNTKILKDPIQILSFCTGLSFNCLQCKDKKKDDADAGKEKKDENDMDTTDNDENANDDSSCNCKFFLEHRATTPEIRTCLTDLKVLNKSDFKGLLKWRDIMQNAIKERDHKANGDDDDNNSGDENNLSDDDDKDEQQDSEAEEEGIQSEIEALRTKKARERKRVVKKLRVVKAKRRKRAALGMDLNAIDVPGADGGKIFSLATITSGGMLEKAREVDLGLFTDDQLFPTPGEDEDGFDDGAGGVGNDVVRKDGTGKIVAQGEEDDIDEDTGYSYRLDREMDYAYDVYLKNTKDGEMKSGTKMAKLGKKSRKAKALKDAEEDEEMMMEEGEETLNEKDTKAYAKILQGPKDSDDDSDGQDEVERRPGDNLGNDDDDDGFHADPVTPKEHSKNLQKTKERRSKGEKEEEGNPLIYTLPQEPTSIKTARWFSNPLFESIGTTASLATMSKGQSSSGTSNKGDDIDSDADDQSNVNTEMDAVEQIGSDDENDLVKKKRRKGEKGRKASDDAKKSSKNGVLTADDVIAMMPKTDKQVRHEKRLKAIEKVEKKKARLSKRDDNPAGFDVVENDEDGTGRFARNNNKKSKLGDVSEVEKKKKLVDAKALIKAGLGKSKAYEKESDGFEVVAPAKPLPVNDTRQYNSDNEDYDSDDYAKTLALGTMMLRRSKAKSMVDASYNRFAWNDPEDLPDWFVDDENRNYRPQLPIPPALMERMKEKFRSLATKPIAKVAEARARKDRNARSKMAAAKKKAETVANSSEMSEATKLKAISRAMRGHDSSRPSKTYVVSKKGGGTKGGKGVKLVDKRMRSDKRGQAHADKKKKSGKTGGLTGGKKRRNHK